MYKSVKQFISTLEQPYPAYKNIRNYFTTVTLLALIVWLVLYILRPFHFGKIKGSDLDVFVTCSYYIAAGYSILCFNSFFIFQLPKLFNTDKWSLGKDFAFFFFSFNIISIAVMFINWSYADILPHAYSYLQAVYMTYSCALLPYLFLLYVSYSKLLRQKLNEVEQLNRDIQLANQSQRYISQIYNTELLYISVSENGIPPVLVENLLYIESRGNYLVLFVIDCDKINEYRIRSTIKNFLDQNVHFPQLLRTHRAFAVNISNIKNVNGNAAGYKVKMHDRLPEVPVSRNLVADFKMKIGTLANIRQSNIALK